MTAHEASMPSLSSEAVGYSGSEGLTVRLVNLVLPSARERGISYSFFSPAGGASGVTSRVTAGFLSVRRSPASRARWRGVRVKCRAIAGTVMKCSGTRCLTPLRLAYTSMNFSDTVPPWGLERRRHRRRRRRVRFGNKAIQVNPEIRVAVRVRQRHVTVGLHSLRIHEPQRLNNLPVNRRGPTIERGTSLRRRRPDTLRRQRDHRHTNLVVEVAVIAKRAGHEATRRRPDKEVRERRRDTLRDVHGIHEVTVRATLERQLLEPFTNSSDVSPHVISSPSLPSSSANFGASRSPANFGSSTVPPPARDDPK